MGGYVLKLTLDPALVVSVQVKPINLHVCLLTLGLEKR